MVKNFEILLAHNMNWSQATLKHTTNEAICYASTITKISDSDKAIIKHSRKNAIYIYIDINSNLPPQMLKQLPKSIDKRLSENSSSKEVFDETKTLYENP